MKRLLISLIVFALLIGSVSAITQYNLTVGSYEVSIFNGTGGSTNWVAPFGVTSVEYLIVAGGGGGSGGGGGAGGVVYCSTYSVTSGNTYVVTIGNGGYAPAAMSVPALNGDNSSFNGVVAIGGGSGSKDPGAGSSGGSGGGGFKTWSGGDADYISPRQGYDGGAGKTATFGWGGGGGGASAVGADAATNAGNGGNGTSYSITGTAVVYAGGGGGGVDSRGGGAAGAGGTGGGGNGTAGGSATNGTAGLGGGGGGAGFGASYGVPAAGGSGTVVLNHTIPTTPVPSFYSNVTSGTQPLAVQFNDTSVTSITNWSWDFGDGNTSILQDPTHVFYDGNWNVHLNVTNASGYAPTTGDYYINVSSSGGLVGWNRQDIILEQVYTLTFLVKDQNTHNGIPGANVSLSNGDNSTTDIFGSVSFPLNYSTIVAQFGATGYQSRLISYIIDRDRTETVYLTALVPTSNVTSQTVTYYTPWQVRLRVLDYNGNPIPNTTIAVNYVASTLPNTSISWLVSAYGVDPTTAAEMTSSSVAMVGTTDDNGGLSFTMFKSIQYTLAITNVLSGVSATKTLYPTDQEYVIRVPLASQVAPTNSLSAMSNTSLPVYQLNASAYNLSVVYHDTSDQTSNVMFYVKWRNGTVIYSKDLGDPGTSVVTDNYTIINPGIGTEVIWMYNATRSG